MEHKHRLIIETNSKNYLSSPLGLAKCFVLYTQAVLAKTFAQPFAMISHEGVRYIYTGEMMENAEVRWAEM